MKVSVPKEAAEGERRVACVPEVAKKLAADGVDVVLEPGAGESSHLPDSAFEEAGASVAAGEGFAGDVVAKVAPPSADEIGRLQRGQRADRLPPAADRAGHGQGAGGRGRHVLRDGGHPAHHARAVDGRAVLPGHRGGLPGGADLRPGARALLPHAHHRGGHDPPRPGAGAGRRRRGAAGHRHLAAAGRGGARLRRALGGRGADPVAGREVREAGHRAGGRRGRGRLRAPADRRGAAAPARGAGRGDRPHGRRDLHRRGAGAQGAAADHRGRRCAT